MALQFHGGAAPPMASFYGQPALGYMGTAMPPTNVAGMPYTGAGFGAAAYPAAAMYTTPAYQSMGTTPYLGGYPPSSGVHAGVNGFNMPSAMQSFNSAGYCGYGTGLVEPVPYSPMLGMSDPYNSYVERMNPTGTYIPRDFQPDFEDDLMCGFGTNSYYGDRPAASAMRTSGSFRANDGYHDLYARGNDSYYDPRRSRYAQRRPKQECC